MSISKFRARSRRGWMSMDGLLVLLVVTSSAVRSSLVRIVAGMLCYDVIDVVPNVEGVVLGARQRHHSRFMLHSSALAFGIKVTVSFLTWLAPN